MSITNAVLKKRILEISYRHKLSHLGSCLTAVDIIKEIYEQKRPEDRFVLSSGHAGLALYVVLEAYGGRNAEEIFNHHGVHPDRCRECGIDCSAGSLGHGLPIAVGMALSDRNKNVYALISDGECAEGSIWEAVRIKKETSLTNLKIYLNHNGYAAYRMTHPYDMPKVDWLVRTNVDYLPFLKGLDAHYYTMSEEDYKQALEILV